MMLLNMKNMNREERRQIRRKRESARFIFSLQLKLLQKALAPWHRRSARLVEINCGDGSYLPFLWHSGFEVIATEANPVLREQAEAQKPFIEIRAAQDNDLPFEDDSFDWAIMHIIPRPDSQLESSLQECMRVAKRGLMFSFWNSASLPCLCWRLSHRQAWPPNSISLARVWKHVKNLRIGSMSVMTTLLAPFCSWRQKKFFLTLNSAFSLIPVGAWGLIRLDLDKPKLVTPLRIRLENVLTQAMPAMEFTEKNTVQKQD